MKTIWKYPLEVADRQTVTLPEGAEILTVQVQDGAPFLWALVNDTGNYEGRFIWTFGTGHDMDRGVEFEYIGTFQLKGGALVFHVFEEHA